MFWIDQKYVSLVSVRLRNYKRKSNELWNFSCPYCNDSIKHKNKARGYLYVVKGTLLYRCHKCSIGASFPNFLKHIDPLLYKEYTLEKYQSNASPHPHAPKLEFPSALPVFKTVVDKSPLDELYKISDLNESHPAVQYVAKRMIPKDKWDLLYFAPNYIGWCKKHYNKPIPIKEDSPRLVIPLFNSDDVLIGWTGRCFGNEYLRYHKVRLIEDQLMIFGLERVNLSNKVKLVEGEIDSLFLDNAIASGGISSFDNEYTKQNKENVVFIVDNEPRAIQIVKVAEKYIKLGYSLCLFPDTILEKDINDMIMAGRTKEELEQIIEENTVSGIEATLKLIQWKKV